MDDREVVAAMAVGSPAGVAMAYDKYGAALYGYCHWRLGEPASAAEALQHTFVIAAGRIDDLADASKLRPWLYAVARDECQRRNRAAPPPPSGEAGAADHPGGTGAESARLETLIHDILAELPPGEREVIELTVRHDLHDSDLAWALRVSWNRAHTLNSRAFGRLERALGALFIARTGRKACPVLDGLLAGWDGHLTEAVRNRVAGHVEHCETCAARRRGVLRPSALAGLLPLAPVPPALREQVRRLCLSAAPEVVAYRRQVIRGGKSVRPTRFARAISRSGGDRGRRYRRPAAATVLLSAWVAAVWAASVTLLVLTGSHRPHTAAPQPSVGTATSPAAAATTIAVSPTPPAITPTSASLSPSPTLSPTPTFSQPPVVVPPPSPSRSPSPSKSPSPSPSKSPSSSPSASPSPSPSASPSPSPSKRRRV